MTDAAQPRTARVRRRRTPSRRPGSWCRRRRGSLCQLWHAADQRSAVLRQLRRAPRQGAFHVAALAGDHHRDRGRGRPAAAAAPCLVGDDDRRRRGHAAAGDGRWRADRSRQLQRDSRTVAAAAPTVVTVAGGAGGGASATTSTAQAAKKSSSRARASPQGQVRQGQAHGGSGGEGLAGRQQSAGIQQGPAARHRHRGSDRKRSRLQQEDAQVRRLVLRAVTMAALRKRKDSDKPPSSSSAARLQAPRR